MIVYKGNKLFVKNSGQNYVYFAMLTLFVTIIIIIILQAEDHLVVSA